MTDMLAQIRSLGDQLRWAADLDPPHVGTFSEILYAGMGGSGIAGDYAGAVAYPVGTRIAVHKGYGPIPPWAIRQRPLLIAASYSGNTEETLDMVTSAWESGLTVATVTTGGRLAELTTQHGWRTIAVPPGLQPRAAVGYMVGAVLRLLEGSHSVDDQRLAFTEAAKLADEMTAEDSPAWQQAEEIAEGLEGRIPIIYGAGPVTGVVAQRWKTQLNENAKIPAWYSVLPELDHNEITGWETMPGTTREHVGIVALTDPGDHDRVAIRIGHTRELTESAVPWVGVVPSSGTSTLARLVSLTAVGDLVSWMLAERLGVDPVPVATIEELKKLLADD
ncbi:MAG TPA: bifunctional phosphoglucose/phosphomannose isomerase [Acidimicrobiia bacterium]|jgi:glucose/mannose-6-phosphate isomerase|nr:bifunctional phosphoglucose/phosphomannose isomerase [Acidimicrobiia bacterium]